MKNRHIGIFHILILVMLFAACKHGAKKHSGYDNPIFQEPAIKTLTDKINNDTGNARLYFDRAHALHSIEQDSLAINDYEKAISLDSTKAEYYSAIGNLLFDHKDISGSVHWLQKAIQLNPKDPAAHLKIAKMFLYLQDNQKAFNEINVVMRQDVYNPEPYFLKGMVYLQMKDTAKAISSFQSAVQASPTYRDAVVELGQVYSAQNNPIALEYYNHAFRIDSLDVFPLFAKGVYYQRNNDYNKAKEEYQNCVLHDNQYAQAYFNTGWILLQQDSVEKALRQYDLVTRIQPNNPDAYYNRGLCYEMMNKKQEAINDYKQVLLFDKKYTNAQVALKRLGVK